MIGVNAIRIKLEKSYRETYDLLSEMPCVLSELGLSRPPSYVTIHNWFKRIPTQRWRAFLRASAEKRGRSHAAIDSTGFDRDRPSRYYAQRAHYRVRSLKVTFLVDVNTLSVLDLHCSASRKGEVPTAKQIARRNAGDLHSLAGDRGYDSNLLRQQLRTSDTRPLIRHRIMASYDHAHNARIDADLYNQRWMVETVISSIKRTLGSAVRARSWSLELREMILKCAVYNIRTTLRR
jgi:IS5 family transposase